MKNIAIRFLFTLLLIGTTSLSIISCGQKGPLYLPDSNNASKKN